MSIYVNRIIKVNQKLPPVPEPNVLNLNCLNFFSNNVMHDIPLYQISPYYLKDAEGHIFESIYQFSKYYERVSYQNQIKGNKIIWSHPEEVHVMNGEFTPAFWAWRKKGWNHPYAVRYPNGYDGRSACIGALWNENGNWITLPYIPARKKIYCKVYAELVQTTGAYKMLKALYDSGQSLQICEMDVRPGLVTEEVLRREINNPDFPFGHGYVLATCLMGLTHIFDE
jgi:hypothetical protein